VETGRVEEALSKEPWLMIDRLPPDLVDTLGAEMGANAILQGAVLAYGVREDPEGPLPEVSLSLRLLETPGGRVLWSAVHSRGGSDGESVFGFGRVANLERLAANAIEEIMKTFPAASTQARACLAPRGREEVTPWISCWSLACWVSFAGAWRTPPNPKSPRPSRCRPSPTPPSNS
jgi:hypothetical protein